MKRNQIPEITDKIFFQNFENLFNVYKTADDQYFYNINRTINIPDTISSIYYKNHSVVYGDTWTGLADKYHRDVKLWWLICAANHIINPIEFPVPGSNLKILTDDVVQAILTDIRDS